jgi:hypothetical protein
MCASSPSRAELLKSRERWALVNQREQEAARLATLEEKLDELERLMQSIDDFGWRAVLDDDAPVRERWNRLRSKLGGIGARGTRE